MISCPQTGRGTDGCCYASLREGPGRGKRAIHDRRGRGESDVPRHPELNTGGRLIRFDGSEMAW
jgi:hypothetical protein